MIFDVPNYKLTQNLDLTKALDASMLAIFPVPSVVSTNEANTSCGNAGRSSVYGASAEHWICESDHKS